MKDLICIRRMHLDILLSTVLQCLAMMMWWKSSWREELILIGLIEEGKPHFNAYFIVIKINPKK